MTKNDWNLGKKLTFFQARFSKNLKIFQRINQMLGVIARFDYNKSTKMKSEIYSKKIMKRVRLAIKKCCAN